MMARVDPQQNRRHSSIQKATPRYSPPPAGPEANHVRLLLDEVAVLAQTSLPQHVMRKRHRGGGVAARSNNTSATTPLPRPPSWGRARVSGHNTGWQKRALAGGHEDRRAAVTVQLKARVLPTRLDRLVGRVTAEVHTAQ